MSLQPLVDLTDILYGRNSRQDADAFWTRINFVLIGFHFCWGLLVDFPPKSLISVFTHILSHSFHHLAAAMDRQNQVVMASSNTQNSFIFHLNVQTYQICHAELSQFWVISTGILRFKEVVSDSFDTSAAIAPIIISFSADTRAASPPPQKKTWWLNASRCKVVR